MLKVAAGMFNVNPSTFVEAEFVSCWQLTFSQLFWEHLCFRRIKIATTLECRGTSKKSAMIFTITVGH